LLRCDPASRSAHVPHLASLSSAGFNRVATTRIPGPLLAAVLSFYRKDSDEFGESI
jgi:hypothetical protein